MSNGRSIHVTEKLLFDQLLDLSARVGSLIVPAASLEAYLGRFASQLTVWTHDDVYKVSIPGSAIGLMHADRAMLVCSMHQLKNVELRDVSILLPGGSKAVTSSGSRTFQIGDHPSSSDAYDLAAFDFTEPAIEFSSLTRNFFKFDCVPPDTPNTHILGFVVAGYPTADQKYELGEKNHLGTVRRVLVAEPDCQPTDSALLKLKFVRHLDFDPDGLSGGPAFVIQLVEGECRAYLGGMVLRAGRSDCYILKSGYLWSFLSSFK